MWSVVNWHYTFWFESKLLLCSFQLIHYRIHGHHPASSGHRTPTPVKTELWMIMFVLSPVLSYSQAPNQSTCPNTELKWKLFDIIYINSFKEERGSNVKCYWWNNTKEGFRPLSAEEFSFVSVDYSQRSLFTSPLKKMDKAESSMKQKGNGPSYRQGVCLLLSHELLLIKQKLSQWTCLSRQDSSYPSLVTRYPFSKQIGWMMNSGITQCNNQTKRKYFNDSSPLSPSSRRFALFNPLHLSPHLSSHLSLFPSTCLFSQTEADCRRRCLTMSSDCELGWFGTLGPVVTSAVLPGNIHDDRTVRGCWASKKKKKNTCLLAKCCQPGMSDKPISYLKKVKRLEWWSVVLQSLP